ncbi:hypothetical protein Rhopal_003468-T1 [Rhodotorula paludigena]|uniref:Uncharacterized protein n=1 Tax=Rhodotorula paludigena TaxID=86838 RepID=A0AAV5GN48_9BASI|nr:hypothetical protein Rhopal_003468-T1 [Rhodotorula paludigena]
MANEQRELALRVHELLDRGNKINPGLIEPWNAVHGELVARLLSTFLAGHPAHQLVFLRVYQFAMNVPRIVDIAQDLKALDHVLGLRPFVLALDPAALASRREYLKLDEWLSIQLAQRRAQLVRATLEFVGRTLQHELRRQELDHARADDSRAQRGDERHLHARPARSLFSGDDVELFKDVCTQCLQLHPRLVNFSRENTDSEPGMAVTSFSPKVEAECDALYKRMYELRTAVDKVVAELRQAKKSDDQHDHALSLTACLLGDLIQFRVIDFVPLGIAVRCALDALRNPPESHWFRFGIQSLARFQGRLGEWPQLAHSILSIPHVAQLRPTWPQRRRKQCSVPGGAELGDLSGAGGAFSQQQQQQQAPQGPERLWFTAI